MLSSILAQFNIEQNAAFSAKIYEAQYNTITSLLLNKLAKTYPDSQDTIDQIDPFVKQELIPVTNGFIQLPEDYRNMLGSPMVSAKQDGSGECSDLPITASDFKVSIQKGKCKLNPLIIVPESEFAYRTRSTYDFPTITDPIGYFIGKKQIKVCPYDISKVLVTYCRNENRVVVFYELQPDDTYIIDESKSQNPEWGNNAFDTIFTAFNALYASYSRDQDLQNWTQILKQAGIL